MIKKLDYLIKEMEKNGEDVFYIKRLPIDLELLFYNDNFSFFNFDAFLPSDKAVAIKPGNFQGS